MELMIRTMVLILASLPLSLSADFKSWWLTPDQQGQRLYSQERYPDAAEAYEDLMHKGTAYYRAGEFEKAASVFGRIAGPEALYNRGNSLIFLGRYEEAIEAYDRALELQPDWAEAQENRQLASARRDALAPPEDDAGGTGGKLEADEIVFDDTGRVNEGGTEVETQGEEMASDEEMRQIWLRRVENDPGDFLRARFAYQLFREQQSDE